MTRILRSLTAAMIAVPTLTLAACANDGAEVPEPTRQGSVASIGDASDQPNQAQQPTQQDAPPAAGQDSAAGSPAGTVAEGGEPVEMRDAAGTVCGKVTVAASGGELSVVSLDDGTSCSIAIPVLDDYLSAQPSGDAPAGSGYYWESPTGWTCMKGYLFPGDEPVNANMYPVCTNGFGPGQAAAVDPARVHEMGF